MRDKLLHPATAIATLALLVALGAPGYAASLIDGARLKPRSVTTGKLKDGAVAARKLAPAVRAGTLLPCPAGTARVETSCLERTRRVDATWTAARDACSALGRRLPSVAELNAYRLRGDLAPPTIGSEWTDTVVTNTDALLVVFTNGAVGPADAGGAYSYRCAAPARMR